MPRRWESKFLHDLVKTNKITMLVFLMLLCIVGANANYNTTGWNQLSVTFKRYTSLPMNENDAAQKGWELHYDSCSDTCTPFKGKRYKLNGDYSTMLIFDVNGHVAGMQMAYKTKLRSGIYRKYSEAFQIVEERDSDYYYHTVYFTEPNDICNPNVRRPQGLVGDRLVVQVAPNDYQNVPLTDQDLGGKWVKGTCMPGMGTHYWYDITADMICDDFYPIFTLYNKDGKLNGFGFVAGARITGANMEYIQKRYISYFFQKATTPKCLTRVQRRTQHVYLMDVTAENYAC